MRGLVVRTLALWLVSSLGAFAASTANDDGSLPAKSPFPLQLAISVPCAPVAFRSAGSSHLVYELYLTNFSGSSMSIRQIEVRDADAAPASVAIFSGEKLAEILDPVGGQGTPGSDQLAPGSTTVAYIWISVKDGDHVPDHLSNLVSTSDGAVEGAVVGTHDSKLRVLAPPVRGEGWMASDGPSNDRSNHHRRGILVVDGKVVLSRRYAIDWMLTKHGGTVSGDKSVANSYFAFGEPVYAVADAIVLHAKDGQPDNVPALPSAFHSAVPITMDTVGGNNIVLDLGNGAYAYYMHLHPGSVQVKVGDHVRRGQMIARIGCSGDATVPHLHFEVTTSPKLVAGEGLPYVIDQYDLRVDESSWQRRKNELPLDKMIVNFGPVAGTER